MSQEVFSVDLSQTEKNVERMSENDWRRQGFESLKGKIGANTKEIPIDTVISILNEAEIKILWDKKFEKEIKEKEIRGDAGVVGLSIGYVIAVQSALKLLEFDVGVIDGVLGDSTSKTKIAITKFKESHRIKEAGDELIGPLTIKALIQEINNKKFTQTVKADSPSASPQQTFNPEKTPVISSPSVSVEAHQEHLSEGQKKILKRFYQKLFRVFIDNEYQADLANVDKTKYQPTEEEKRILDEVENLLRSSFAIKQEIQALVKEVIDGFSDEEKRKIIIYFGRAGEDYFKQELGIDLQEFLKLNPEEAKEKIKRVMLAKIKEELQKMFKDQLSPDQIDNLAERFSEFFETLEKKSLNELNRKYPNVKIKMNDAEDFNFGVDEGDKARAISQFFSIFVKYFLFKMNLPEGNYELNIKFPISESDKKIPINLKNDFGKILRKIL